MEFIRRTVWGWMITGKDWTKTNRQVILRIYDKTVQQSSRRWRAKLNFTKCFNTHSCFGSWWYGNILTYDTHELMRYLNHCSIYLREMVCVFLYLSMWCIRLSYWLACTASASTHVCSLESEIRLYPCPRGWGGWGISAFQANSMFLFTSNKHQTKFSL